MSYDVAVLVCCYKRPEYTKKCLEGLEKNTKRKNAMFFLIDDGSNDKTARYLLDFKLPHRTFLHKDNLGLRERIIDFFELVNETDVKYIAKVDNDTVVPKNWLTDLIKIYERCGVDVLSPNVTPSDAASNYCKADDKGYVESGTIGGLWFMEKALIEDMFFERIGCGGIKSAHQILDQISTEKDAKFGFTREVVFDDIGHWSGMHPDHIKSDEHREYSAEINRRIAW